MCCSHLLSLIQVLKHFDSEDYDDSTQLNLYWFCFSRQFFKFCFYMGSIFNAGTMCLSLTVLYDVGSILVPCLFITHIISSVLRSIICVVVDSEGFSIPSSQAVVVEILFLMAAWSYCLAQDLLKGVFIGNGVLSFNQLLCVILSPSLRCFMQHVREVWYLELFLIVILYFFLYMFFIIFITHLKSLKVY